MAGLLASIFQGSPEWRTLAIETGLAGAQGSRPVLTTQLMTSWFHHNHIVLKNAEKLVIFLNCFMTGYLISHKRLIKSLPKSEHNTFGLHENENFVRSRSSQRLLTHAQRLLHKRAPPKLGREVITWEAHFSTLQCSMLKQTSTESAAASGAASNASRVNGIRSRVPAQVQSPSSSTIPQVNFWCCNVQFMYTIMSHSQLLTPTLTTGPAQRAAMVAATSSTNLIQPIRRNTLLTFDQLMALRLVRNSTVQPIRSAPPPLIPCDTSSTQAHLSNVNLETSMTALAALQSEAAPKGGEGIIPSNHIAGPASATTLTNQTNAVPPQNSILEQNGENDNSESDKSSDGDDLSTLQAAMKTRSDNLLTNSQAQRLRVTSPPQAVTATNPATTSQDKPNNTFYSAPHSKRPRRTAAPAPAPEKRRRKEIKARNPPKRGYKWFSIKEMTRSVLSCKFPMVNVGQPTFFCLSHTIYFVSVMCPH